MIEGLGPEDLTSDLSIKDTEQLTGKDNKYYTSGELTAYVIVGVLSSMLLVILAIGIVFYLKRKRRKEEEKYSITMRKSARRIDSWTRKVSSVNTTTVEDWHDGNILESTVSHRALTEDTSMDTPLASMALDQQVLFSQEM